ncbi:MAG: hypothetical protein HKN36_09455 [Hellea sp.]|nr:hypothetical protein [Hellea sp.]
MKSIFLKFFTGAAFALSGSAIAMAASNPEIVNVEEWRRSDFQPCSSKIYFQADQNRNVSGGFDFIQYQVVGIFSDGREVNYSADPWYGNFGWDWVRGVDDLNTIWFYGPWGGSSSLPERWEIRFYNGTNQWGSVGPHLATLDLDLNCENNTPPVADAGQDIYYAVPNMQVYLDGSFSSDADGDNLTYTWTQIAGSAVALIDDSTSAPSFIYPPGRADQQIEFELVVNDGKVDSEADSVIVIHNGRSNGKANGRN